MTTSAKGKEANIPKTCTKCHAQKPATPEFWPTKPDGRLSQPCRLCKAAQNRERYHRDPSKKAAQAAKWKAANRQRVRERAKEWYESDKARILDVHRQWRLNNPEKKRTADREWYRNNPDVSAATSQRRRARRRGLPSDWSAAAWDSALAAFGHQCAYCTSRELLEQEHYVPLAHPDCPGTVPSNMVPACRACNRSKGPRHPRDFAPEHVCDEIEAVLRTLQ